MMINNVIVIWSVVSLGIKYNSDNIENVENNIYIDMFDYFIYNNLLLYRLIQDKWYYSCKLFLYTIWRILLLDWKNNFNYAALWKSNETLTPLLL